MPPPRPHDRRAAHRLPLVAQANHAELITRRWYDAVLRYNAGGLAGLHDRPRSGRRPRLTEEQRTALRQVVLDGPEVEATGLSAWTLAGLCREVEERWGVSYHLGHMSKLMHRLGLSWQKARPSHPEADAAAREA